MSQYIVGCRSAGMALTDRVRAKAPRYDDLNKAMEAALLMRDGALAKAVGLAPGVKSTAIVTIGIDNGSSLPETPHFWDPTKADQNLVARVMQRGGIEFGIS